MSGKEIYGTRSDGQPIDDETIEQFVREAERGYTAEELSGKTRGRGRPPLGDQAKTVESVRLDANVRERVAIRAASDGVSVSEVIRRALREYLDVPHSATPERRSKRARGRH